MLLGYGVTNTRGTAFRYHPGCMHGHHDLVQSQKRSSNLVMLALFGQHQKSARSKVNIRDTASPDDLVVSASPSRRIARARQHYPDDAQACSNNVVVTGIRLLIMQLAPFRIDRPQARSSRGFRSQSSVSNHFPPCSKFKSDCRHPSDAPHVRRRYEDHCASLPCALCDTRVKAVLERPTGDDESTQDSRSDPGPTIRIALCDQRWWRTSQL